MILQPHHPLQEELDMNQLKQQEIEVQDRMIMLQAQGRKDCDEYRHLLDRIQDIQIHLYRSRIL